MDDLPLNDLIEHLSRTRALDSDEAQQLVAEVLAYFQEPAEHYIRRRHREMQLQGYSNADIFIAIKAEMQNRVFPIAEFSERQIRRTIYG